MNAAIAAPAPWFGGKRNLAARVIQQLGRHSAYFELFAGSMAVLMAKPPAAQETAVDLHGDMTNLAFVLASPRSAELQSGAERILYCEDLFRYFRDQFAASDPPPLPASPRDVDDEHVARALLFLVVAWIGRNGVAGTMKANYQMAIRWTPNGGSGPTRWNAAVRSIEDWHARLRHVVILRRDAFDVVGRISDEPGVALYVDPPYLRHTRGKGGGSSYLHDFEPADHARLATALRRFRQARVVVSYYDDPQLRELYDGWTIVECHVAKALSVSTGRGSERSRRAPEILFVNGPVYVDPAPDLLEETE